MRNHKTYLLKNWRYVILIIILIGFIALGWYLFFCLDIFTASDKRIIGLISYYGLLLGMFQFTINQVNIRAKRDFELRIAAYKEIVKLIETITQALNEKLGTSDKFSFHGYVTKLLNLINEYTLFCKTNHDYLFPGVSKTSESQEVRKILYDILETTDKFRKAIDDAKDDEIYEGFKRVEWHNTIRHKLKDLHEKKYSYFVILRKFL